MQLGNREVHDYPGAHPHFARYIDRSLPPRSDGFADGESEAGTSRVAAARRIAAIEPLENVGQILGRDALAIILDEKLHLLPFLLHHGTYGGTGRTMLQSIQEQVPA